MDPDVENNVKAVRRSKEDKKVLRKQIKASHTLLKHEGIRTTSQPTKVTKQNRSYKPEVATVRTERELASMSLLLLLSTCSYCY